MPFRFFLLLGLISLLGCTSPQVSQAQTTPFATVGDLSRRDNRSLDDVRQAINLREYRTAINGLNQLVERNPVNVDLYFMRAAVLQFQHNKQEAANDFARAIEIAPDYEPEAYKALAVLRQQLGEYSAAVPLYERYLSLLASGNVAEQEEVAALLKTARFAAEAAANPVPFDPQALGPSINSSDHDEYFASISPDGQRLVFTRRIYGQDEDFFLSNLDETGEWTPAQSMEAINTEYNEGAQTLSADGRLMVFTSCDKPSGFGSCDLYFSEKRGGRWTHPRNMGDQVNSRFKETQASLTADGKAMFFASNRPGGKGGMDIWGSARRADGSWGRPVNMGDVINGPQDDHFPFFHPDGQTLYFTSRGHQGLGGNDLFWTRLDTNNIWSPPENMGYPINTTEDENNLFITFDGQWAYYARALTIEGRRRPNIDLFRFELPVAARPAAVTYLQAEVVDKESGLPLVCNVRIRPISEDRSPSTQTTDTDGSFLVVLPAGKTYALLVDEPGYLFHSDQFELSGGADPNNPYRIKIELEPISELVSSSESVVLRNVLFASNSADLLAVSSDELDRLVELLESRTGMRIELGGHTDNIGGEAANKTLSENRAKAVFDYLVAAGINPDRLTYVGYGKSQPIATNDTEAGRAENRRTAFRIINK